MEWTAQDRAFIQAQRVARMATVGAEGAPHVVPVCFAFDGKSFYTAVDQKPKRVAPERLRRIRNLRRNPNVALILDDYDENWSRLRYLLVHGRAALVDDREERAEASRLLKEKYEQYRDVDFATTGWPILRILPARAHHWQASEADSERT